MVRLLVGVAIAIGAVVRIAMLLDSPLQAAPTAALERDVLGERLALGIEESEPYCFSADAAIILGVGADGQPGRAGFDDNLDGTIDDPREIGAVGSDDRCLAPADSGYDEMLSAPGTITISRGSVVPCESGAMPERYLTRDQGWFVVQ